MLNTIKSFVASAVAAVSIVAAPIEALASTAVPGKLNYDQQQLITALHNAGVTIEVGSCEGVIENTLGFYYQPDNFIGICSDVATTVKQRWETLRHEAIHAAQACVDPSMQTTAHSWEYVTSQANEYDARFIVDNYDKEDWAIELEAFTFMRETNLYVAAVVNHACN